ncbi:hypothetical protein PPACK8108_LOCUS20224 [Phakopsora pachyrhizi]|uniref:non-specific serine/threonine protein kinase n=1 Tax=Phakopsora pachyrhizi TaxID=170000 RepID=A0AAV0BH10_PHAPC|nr:hypothetical protein PPACK8108_LOCUS20224 [Phakopsora pachyrhizi]
MGSSSPVPNLCQVHQGALMSKISNWKPGSAPDATDNKTSFSSSESSSSFKKILIGTLRTLQDLLWLTLTWPTIPPPAVPYDPRSLERITVKVADLGQRATSQMTFKLGSTEVPKKSLEAIGVLGLTSGASAIFELLTGEYLFNPYAVWKRYTKDENHVAQIIELLGSLPPNIAFSEKFGHEIFNRCKELRHMQKLKTWPLEAVLTERYCLEKEPAVKLTAFLEPMLNWIPWKRATAQKMLKHSWFDGAVVMSETYEK